MSDNTTTFILKNASGEAEVTEFNISPALEETRNSIDSSLFLIVEDLLNNRIDETFKEDYIKSQSEKNLEFIMTRMQFGRWIRNSYGLWLDSNPYTDLMETAFAKIANKEDVTIEAYKEAMKVLDDSHNEQ